MEKDYVQKFSLPLKTLPFFSAPPTLVSIVHLRDIEMWYSSGEWSEPEIFLDFDISNIPISEFWVTIGERLFFFTVPLSKIIFFSQNQSKEIFFEKNPSPPPLNIKWTVPYK